MAWSQFLTRLVEAVDRHVGRFSNAKLVVKDAHTQADASRVLAQGDRDAEDIRRGKMSLVMGSATTSLENKDIEDLTYEQRIIARLTHQELQKDQNIQKIVAHAALEGEDNEVHQVDKPDDDLLSRIFNEAQYVSNEELQIVWGRLLAGAVSQPQAYTLDVVDFLRRLNSARAREVARMGTYVFSGDSIVRVKRIDEQFPEGFSYWVRMQHYGLIEGVIGQGLEAVYTSANADKYECGRTYGAKVLVWSHDTKRQEKVKLKAYMVTELGRQVFSLGKFEEDELYLRQIAQDIKKRYPDFKVIIADVVAEEHGAVHWMAPIEIAE